MSRKTALELERLAGLRLAGEQWAAERTALPAAKDALRAGARLLESAAQNTAEVVPALGRMRDAGGAAMESAELIPASALVLMQGTGLAESLREAPAASGRTFAESAPADNASVQGVSAQGVSVQNPVLGRMRDAGGAAVESAALVPVSELVLAQGAGSGSGAAPALGWRQRAVLPGTGSLAAQTEEEPLSRTAVLNLGDVPAAWASMRQAARKSDFALADTPEQSVRFSAALPENGLPASGEAQLTSLPRPAGKKEKPDGAEKSGENRSAARRDAQESGTEDFWGLWARRFAGELHSSAEGVHG